LGKCLLQAGDARGAIENHRRSLAIIEELSAADGANSEFSKDVDVAKQYLAEAQLAAGEYEAALAGLRQSVSYLEASIESGATDIQIKDDLALWPGQHRQNSGGERRSEGRRG
jgi:hypothetical protein